jgi:hypothetical protein
MTSNRAGPVPPSPNLDEQRRYQNAHQESNTFTMVRTRRSSGGKGAASVEPFQDRQQQRHLGVQTAGIHRLGRGTEECFDLVQRILAQAVEGFWYRILPVDDHDDDITVGTGVEWQYLLPLLSKCSLLRSRVTSVVKEIDCYVRQWDEMAKSMISTVKLEITCTRTQYARRSYFFCVGKPRYQTPTKQETGLQVNKKCLPRKTPARSLMYQIKEAATKVLNGRIADRVQPNPPVPLNDEQIDCVAESINSAIRFAAALDLDWRPRLSRTNAGK